MEFFYFLFLTALSFGLLSLLRPKSNRVKHEEWTQFENGRPICGVGHRGYWTNRASFGGPFPFEQRQDGSWFDPKTGNDCVVMNLKEFLERNANETTS